MVWKCKHFVRFFKHIMTNIFKSLFLTPSLKVGMEGRVSCKTFPGSNVQF